MMLWRTATAMACTVFILQNYGLAQAQDQQQHTNALKAHRRIVQDNPTNVSDNLLPTTGQPQEYKNTPLTLEAAISIALKQYPTLRVAAAKIAAAQGETAVVKTSYLPRSDFFWQNNWGTANQQMGLFFPMPGLLPVAGGYTKQNWQTGFGAYGGLVTSITAYDFGYRRAKMNAAKAGEKIALANQQLTEFDVAAAAANAFLQAATAQSLVKTAEADFERSRVLFTIVSTLTKNGLRPGADESRSLADVAQSETQLIKAKEQAKLTLIQLAHTLGLAGEEVTINAGPFLTTSPATSPFPMKYSSHPAVQAELSTIDSLIMQKKVTARSYLPKLNMMTGLMSRGSAWQDASHYLGGGHGTYPNMMNYAVAVTLNWTPTDVFEARAREKVQQANIEAEKAKYDELIEQLKTADAQAKALIESATQIAQHTPVQIAAAKMANLQTTQRYKAGLATLADVAEAQKLLTQAEVDDSLAKLGVWSAYLGGAESKGSLTPFMSLVRQYQTLNLNQTQMIAPPMSTTGTSAAPTTLTPAQLNPGQPNAASLSPVLVNPSVPPTPLPLPTYGQNANQKSLGLPVIHQRPGAPLSPDQINQSPQVQQGGQ